MKREQIGELWPNSLPLIRGSDIGIYGQDAKVAVKDQVLGRDILFLVHFFRNGIK